MVEEMLLRTASVPSLPSLAVIMFCLACLAAKLIEAAPFQAVSPGNTEMEPAFAGPSTVMLMVTAATPAGMVPCPATANRAILVEARPPLPRVSNTRVESTGRKVPACGVAAGWTAAGLVVAGWTAAGLVAAEAAGVPSSTTQPLAAVIRQDRMATSRRMQLPRQHSDGRAGTGARHNWHTHTTA